MAKQYSLKDISVITLRHITVDDDLREFIEKVNFNFDQILSVLDNRFYDEISKNVLKLLASGKYLQYLTDKPSKSVQWIGKPGRRGERGIGKKGEDGRSIYVSTVEIEDNSFVNNADYKKGDVVLDKTGNIYLIDKNTEDKLYYKLQFQLSTRQSNTKPNPSNPSNPSKPDPTPQSYGNIITTEDKYSSKYPFVDSWMLYDFNNSVYGSNNIILASADYSL